MENVKTTLGLQGICPTGWHIPTDGEWTTVTTLLGGEDVAGGKMKSTGTFQTGTGLWAPTPGPTKVGSQPFRLANVDPMGRSSAFATPGSGGVRLSTVQAMPGAGT